MGPGLGLTVYDAWAEEEKTDIAATRHRRVRFLERIAHDAYRDGQYSAATAAVRQLCRIEGLEQIGVKHQHTLDANTSWFVASLLGVVTGTFGGVIGDVICNEVPSLFTTSPLYATCAFLGS